MELLQQIKDLDVNLTYIKFFNIFTSVSEIIKIKVMCNLGFIKPICGETQSYLIHIRYKKLESINEKPRLLFIL